MDGWTDGWIDRAIDGMTPTVGLSVEHVIILFFCAGLLRVKNHVS